MVLKIKLKLNLIKANKILISLDFTPIDLQNHGLVRCPHDMPEKFN